MPSSKLQLVDFVIGLQDYDDPKGSDLEYMKPIKLVKILRNFSKLSLFHPTPNNDEHIWDQGTFKFG